MNTDIFDVPQAAVYLRISAFTIRRLARDKALPAFKIGGSWRFKKEMLDAWAYEEARVSSGRKPPRERPIRVLVIDDDTGVHETLKNILESKPIRLLFANSGPDGLKKMGENGADLIFLDLKMSGMEGAEILGYLRKSWPDLPVVILTAYPASDMIRRALLYAPVTMIPKPFTTEQILACIKHCAVRASTAS